MEEEARGWRGCKRMERMERMKEEARGWKRMQEDKKRENHKGLSHPLESSSFL